MAITDGRRFLTPITRHLKTSDYVWAGIAVSIAAWFTFNHYFPPAEDLTPVSEIIKNEDGTFDYIMLGKVYGEGPAPRWVLSVEDPSNIRSYNFGNKKWSTTKFGTGKSINSMTWSTLKSPPLVQLYFEDLYWPNVSNDERTQELKHLPSYRKKRTWDVLSLNSSSNAENFSSYNTKYVHENCVMQDTDYDGLKSITNISAKDRYNIETGNVASYGSCGLSNYSYKFYRLAALTERNIVTHLFSCHYNGYAKTHICSVQTQYKGWHIEFTFHEKHLKNWKSLDAHVVRFLKQRTVEITDRQKDKALVSASTNTPIRP